MTTFYARVESGVFVHRVVVYARDHVEAADQALLVLGLSYQDCGEIAVIGVSPIVHK